MGDKGLWIDHIVFPLEKYKLYKIKINKSRGKGNLYWIKKELKQVSLNINQVEGRTTQEKKLL